MLGDSFYLCEEDDQPDIVSPGGTPDDDCGGTYGTANYFKHTTPARHPSVNPVRCTFMSHEGSHGGMHPYYIPPTYDWSCGSYPSPLEPQSAISTLLESQQKMMKVVDNMSQRLCDVEKVIATLTSSESANTASSSSAEDKTRIPSQLSVSIVII